MRPDHIRIDLNPPAGKGRLPKAEDSEPTLVPEMLATRKVSGDGGGSPGGARRKGARPAVIKELPMTVVASAVGFTETLETDRGSDLSKARDPASRKTPPARERLGGKGDGKPRPKGMVKR